MSKIGKENNTESLGKKLAHELKALALTALFFGLWLAALLIIKWLILAEYQIQFDNMWMALVGALILSKVVLIMEHVSLGTWVREQPAWVDVLLRTALYIFGTVRVLLLEKGFEGRHEYDGFIPSLMSVFQHADIYHVWANTICLTGALLVYNLMTVIRRHLGEGGLFKLFTIPLPEETK